MIVFLTGGIGTGKSTVLSMFHDLGARTVSADEIVRMLYDRPEVQERISVGLAMELPLDREAIARRVFQDAQARVRLESVLHPLVSAEVERLRDNGDSAPIIYEIPLLPDPQPGDLVVAVTAPMDLRLQRLEARGLSRTASLERMAVQPNESEYGKGARFTIVNDGDLAHLRRAVTEVWEGLRRGSSAI